MPGAAGWFAGGGTFAHKWIRFVAAIPLSGWRDLIGGLSIIARGCNPRRERACSRPCQGIAALPKSSPTVDSPVQELATDRPR
jgi:hypothetical protein